MGFHSQLFLTCSPLVTTAMDKQKQESGPAPPTQSSTTSQARSSAEERLARAYGDMAKQDPDDSRGTKVEADKGNAQDVNEEEEDRAMKDALRTQDDFLQYVKTLQVMQWLFVVDLLIMQH